MVREETYMVPKPPGINSDIVTMSDLLEHAVKRLWWLPEIRDKEVQHMYVGELDQDSCVFPVHLVLKDE